jgi:transforming growth factor-beta-induced protein
MNFRQLVHAVAVVIVVQSVPSISGGDSIYDIAGSADDFTTLVQAVNAADLDDTLSSPGTYTIFAPTNEAFQKLPSSTLKKLLNPIYKPQLTDLLLYHALGDEVVFSSDLSDGMEATTLNGEDITITLNPPRINQKSKIILEDGLYDIEASNGVIHAIDTLLTPTSYSQNIIDIANSDTDNFSTLLLAAKKAGLVDELTGDGPFTLFAPTNDAFDKLPPGTLNDLLLPANKKTLQEILLYHVVPGNIVSSELSSKECFITNSTQWTINYSRKGWQEHLYQWT